MKVGIIISTDEPETVFNDLRLGNLAINEGKQVNVFLLGYGVELDKIEKNRSACKGSVSRGLLPRESNSTHHAFEYLK